MSNKFLQGIFRPKNIKKYKGNANNIVYRSSYELSFMTWCDNNENVIEWASEEMFVPYRSPISGRIHRYFPDFLVKVKDKDGAVQKYMVEIKPYKQTIPPIIQENKQSKTRRYMKEVAEWGINSAKWQAAEEWCKSHNSKFLIITEKNLRILT